MLDTVLKIKKNRYKIEEKIRQWLTPPDVPDVRQIRSLNEAESSLEARTFLVKDFAGYGVEFGASTYPLPLPGGCVVDFADPFRIDEGCNAEYKGTHVQVKYQTGMVEMEGIVDNSLDFIVHAHVIEHVNRTLLALRNCHQKLRSGGRMFMAIPHKQYTFDSLRPLTTLEHFISDYENYVPERDVIHLVDYLEHSSQYYANLDGKKPRRLNIFPDIQEMLDGTKVDLHFHTFDEENFSALLDYLDKKIVQWQAIEIIPRPDKASFNEFYVRMTK